MTRSHNDLAEQRIFPRPPDTWDVEEDADSDSLAGTEDAYDALRGYVEGGQLWYVLLHHRTPNPIPYMGRHGWVVLFAVGLSPSGQRLLGLVSHQLCHNLCD